MSNIFTLNALKPCHINLDNIAAIMKSYDNGQWKLEFCIAGGECERLRFFSKNEREMIQVINNILDFCKDNRIEIIVRRNKTDCQSDKRDGHVLIIFTKYNAYINLSSGKIIDIDNREWFVRENDELYFENYDEDDTENVENSSDAQLLNTVLNTNIELMKKITQFEEKISNLKINVITDNTSDQTSTVSIIDEKSNKKTFDSVRIPSQEEMKAEITNNRNSFLRRN